MPNPKTSQTIKEEKATLQANLHKAPTAPALPVITIFVRHSTRCRYLGDEFCKICRCRKHFRWSQNGKQKRKKAGPRSWAEAEEIKRRLEDQLAGRIPREPTNEARSLFDAIELFKTDKRNQGISEGVVDKYARELKRLQSFASAREIFTVAGLSRELLIEYRVEWDTLYPSSNTRQMVQARLKNFCYDNKWLERIPRLSSVKTEEAPTLPLTDKEYKKLLATVSVSFPDSTKTRRVRALIRLMRYSGLAISDAATLRHDELIHDSKKKLYRIVTARQKTGTHVSVPIPPKPP